MTTIDVVFFDGNREAECKPDPKYPDGKDVDLTKNALQKRCCYNLPYPAPRCGAYGVSCKKCGYKVVMTVAGRADDPRTLTMPCKAGGLDA